MVLSKNSFTAIARIPSCAKRSPKTTPMIVLQLAIGISIRDGFHTFLNPKATLTIMAKARGVFPSNLIVGRKKVMALSTVKMTLKLVKIY
jgi:hypothetical protein